MFTFTRSGEVNPAVYAIVCNNAIGPDDSAHSRRRQTLSANRVWNRYNIGWSEQSIEAREQAVRAQRVSQFAKDTFLSASSYWYSPLRAKHDAIQFSDILDNAAARLGRDLGNDPEAEADLRETIGSTYAMLGQPAKGEAQLLLGLQVLLRIRGGAPGIEARLSQSLCNARSYQGRYADARLRDVEQRISYTAGAPVDRIRHRLFAGMVEARLGSALAAERHLRAALETREKEMSRQPDLSVEICVRLAGLLRASGRNQEANQAARRGLAAAAQAYGSYFAAHPFVIELQGTLR